jgi:hypothetical protein
MPGEQAIKTTLPHWALGAPRCTGTLDGIVRGDPAEIVCNECNAVIRSVPSTELRQMLTEMELSLDVSTATCSVCGAVKVRPGLATLLAFTCEQCGAVTKLADDPMIDRFFG